jgi:hypothetical protein
MEYSWLRDPELLLYPGVNSSNFPHLLYNPEFSHRCPVRSRRNSGAWSETDGGTTVPVEDVSSRRLAAEHQHELQEAPILRVCRGRTTATSRSGDERSKRGFQIEA